MNGPTVGGYTASVTPTRKRPALPAALLLLAGVIGCAESRTYSLSLANRTGEPLTVWPVKQGGPFEADWASPEDLALASPSLPPDRRPPVAPPGRTLDADELKGKFASGSRAVLRVYAGDRTLAQLLAVGRGSPQRADVVLTPGANDLVAVREGGRLVITPK